jgi:ATP-dependent helicase HrpA
LNPKELPVYKERNKILSALEDNQVIVVESPTGSGMTTQIPIILHEAGYTNRGIIGITQPRRIATLSVCDYIAKQLGSTVPGEVGYKMRFEDQTVQETRMKILTDGTLLQEMKTDPHLSRYSVLMIDEAHERSLNIDFILGLLKELVLERKDLKVIISSATLNTEVFSRYFYNCPIVSIDTPVFPVQIVYDALAVDNNEEVLYDKITNIVERLLSEKRKGDILIFLSGEKHIKETVNRLSLSSVKRKLYLIPLYGRLSKEEQHRVFDKTPFGKTKVVVSTNIAETSLTIDGITMVIDSGLFKMNLYNPLTFTSSLVERGISKASGNQRKGRAGRTQPGSCYRLYSKESFDAKEAFTLEEIYRTDLAEVVLRMAELGIEDFYSFDFISSPGKKGIQGAVETLQQLEALDKNNHVTSIGKMMLRFPLAPRHSRMIVEGINRYPDVLGEVLIATSFLSTNNPFLFPQGEEMEARKAQHHFRDELGDFLSYVKVFDSFVRSEDKKKFCERYYLDEKIMNELVNINDQLSQIVSEIGVPISRGGPTEDFLCACARGLIQFVCVKSARGLYRSLTADKIIIHPGSVMFRENPPYLMAGEIMKTSRMYARSVSPLKKEWINRVDKSLLNELNNFTKKTPKREETLRKDAKANSFIINQTSFPYTVIQKRKGRKKTIALLEWNKLWKAVKNLNKRDIPNFAEARGILVLNGVEVISNGRINTLIKVVQTINPKKDIISGIPEKNYHLENPAHIKGLTEQLNDLLKLVTSGKRKKRGMAFLSLQTDYVGHYWFKAAHSFNQALSESFASLEKMADEAPEDLPEEQWGNINRAYRKLDKLYTY